MSEVARVMGRLGQVTHHADEQEQHWQMDHMSDDPEPGIKGNCWSWECLGTLGDKGETCQDTFMT